MKSTLKQGFDGLSRRGFLGAALGTAGVGMFGSWEGLMARAQASELWSDSTVLLDRRDAAFQLRLDAATLQRSLPLPAQENNGDERRYARRFGSYSKGLPHTHLGLPNKAAFDQFAAAMDSGDEAAIAAISLGGTVKLANPQAAYAFVLEGADSHHLTLPPAPAFASAWEAGEMVEVYWRALCRDIHFDAYGADGTIGAAAADLSALSDFRGPKDGGVVTTDTIFRGPTAGDLTGPLISQLLYQPYFMGALAVEQRFRTSIAGNDFLTDFVGWRDNQNGKAPASGNTFDGTARYIRNLRDLTEWVHRDFSYQGGLSAALILLGYGGAALDAHNPYLAIANQGGFITFGGADILDLVGRTSAAALKAAWCQKWLVHRRLRPEEFGGRVHVVKKNLTSMPIHADVLDSDALARVFDHYDSYLLPMAYPEGCPTHPAYPAGHATLGGAFCTVLKAFFNEDFPIPSPKVPNADGTALLPYTGPTLTVGGELNKLAANIALGRDAAGVHWRSDGEQGILLGEELAIRQLRDLRTTYPETFAGFTLTKFDGTQTVI